MPKKQVLLAAGFDYEFAGFDFVKRSKNRIARLIAKFPKEQFRFTLFDIGAGKISQNELDERTGKRVWSTVATFSRVSEANYSKVIKRHPNHFDKNQSGVLSIKDVYSFIRKIGAGPDAGSVVELSF